MPRLHPLLHEARFRTHWQALLLALVFTVAWFAFVPGDGNVPEFQGADKLKHLLAFGALGATALCARPAGVQASVTASVALLGYGGLIEIVQTQIPGRTASWADLAADAAGIALGLALATALRRAWPPRR